MPLSGVVQTAIFVRPELFKPFFFYLYLLFNNILVAFSAEHPMLYDLLDGSPVLAWQVIAELSELALF